jgi:hypothetical protein
MRSGGEVSAEAQQFLGRVDETYIILIEGMPQNIARQALADANRVRKSFLKAGKREIPLAKIGTNQRGRNLDIVLMFDKTEPIRLEDNEVEVDAKLGAFEVKKKFKLKDMVVNGKLEL